MSVASKTVSRFPVPERVARIPRPIPSRPATTAPQPSLRRPRVAVQIPSAMATMPTAIGHVGERASIGGIARKAANAPRRDRDVAGRRGIAQPVADGVVQALPPGGHAAAFAAGVCAGRRGRSFLREFQA